ncbi:protein asteroid [Acyrthosiphon pisum]|uniref:XPG N-terminal domain-containing protein n=1 Tax=Acyrthosiphon pisum TaxID=7029 RepID=A0A8R2B212_ACYPI|nr:protein asteroid [Acyrthosiphon pisum]|eukprot:XP_008180179.1 PREDICTED: protein asteroid [Acyrthosiphon pisum]
MGIPGLTSFINRNSTQYFENLQLKDTLVIIDGYALTNFLYRLYENQTSAFGGDYDVLAKVYTDFINLLTRCNITPIFVFDGAYEQRKMETIMSRMSQRIQSYGQPMKSAECMPMFGSDVIFDILNDMDIPHINCDFEADSEIVALAKLLDCPVISRDSDFYINTVPYIPLDKIILDLDSNIKVMNCQVYKVEKLLNEFGGLNLDYLPLVAALLGNDYIRQDTFSSLLRLNPGCFNCGLKLKRITDWLRKQHDIKSAISNMTYNLYRNSDYIKNQINNIIKDYKNMNSKYLSFILQYKKMSTYRDRLRHLKPNEKSILPPWLEYNYRRGTINAEVMTIVTLKKIFFKVQIEDYEKLPYYIISFKIMERIIGLLFGKGESIPTIGRKNGLNIGQYKVAPYITNPYIPLADLNKSEMVYRKNIILNLVGIKKLHGVPKDMELFILILIYWAVHTNNIKSKHMHALIVCAITFNVIKKIEIDPKNKKTEDNNGKSVIEENITRVNKEDCIKAMSVLSNYFQVGQYYNNKHLYYKIIHSFAQFQSCVYFFMILNSLLDFPFDQCRIENFYKGTFLYNLCVEMENCDPEVFVSSKLFKKLDSLNNVYKSIIKHINVLLPAPKKRATVTQDTNNSSRPKGKKTQKNQK